MELVWFRPTAIDVGNLVVKFYFQSINEFAIKHDGCLWALKDLHCFFIEVETQKIVLGQNVVFTNGERELVVHVGQMNNFFDLETMLWETHVNRNKGMSLEFASLAVMAARENTEKDKVILSEVRALIAEAELQNVERAIDYALDHHDKELFLQLIKTNKMLVK